MAKFVAVPHPPSRDELRDYIIQMVTELATMARDNGDARLAALLERVLAAVTAGAREH